MLCDFQFGVLSSRSTTHVLLHLTDLLNNAFEKNRFVLDNHGLQLSIEGID